MDIKTKFNIGDIVYYKYSDSYFPKGNRNKGIRKSFIKGDLIDKILIEDDAMRYVLGCGIEKEEHNLMTSKEATKWLIDG